MSDYLFVYDTKEKKVIKESNLPYSVKLNDIKSSGNCSFEANASLGKERFTAAADYWGINTHYYYYKNGLFIVSSSLPLVLKQVKGIKLSQNDIFDVLFFGYPYAGRTVFEGMNRLKASEQLEFDLALSRVEVTWEDNFDAFFQGNGKSPDEERLKNILDNNFKDMELTNPLIALSAGSDTRTLLATLLHYQVKPSALSFGDHRSLELKDIEKLCRKYNINLNSINSRIKPGDYIDTLRFHMKNSNYLLNGKSIHITNLFKNKSKEPVNIFMGFMGSELVKGQLSESRISYPFRDLIAGKSPGEIAAARFKHLKTGIQKNFEEYLSGVIIPRVFTGPDKNDCLVKFCFHHLPHNLLAPYVTFARHQGYHLVLPYLANSILTELFSTGSGIIHNNIFREDFSWQKSFRFQSLWIKLMSRQLYRSFIPKYGASLHTVASLPKKFRSARYALHLAIGKYYHKRPFPGQIERAYLDEAKRKHILSNNNSGMVSSLLNLDYPDRLERIDMDNLNYISLCEEAVQ